MAGEDLAEIDFPFSDAEAAAAGDAHGAVMKRVLGLARRLIEARRRRIEIAGISAAQRLMRAFIIVNINETVEAGLLLQDVHARRPGGFLLQGQMHTFMAAVLLRIAGRDALEANAETQPPDRELR